MSLEGQDYVVACVIATEVPPVPQGSFTNDMIPLALRCVADVIRNRVASPDFPHTAVEVVLQKNQFSAVCREDYWRRAMAGLWQPRHVDLAMKIWQARQPTVVPEALWYYSPISMVPKDSEPSWLSGKTEVLVPTLSREYFRFYRPT